MKMACPFFIVVEALRFMVRFPERLFSFVVKEPRTDPE